MVKFALEWSVLIHTWKASPQEITEAIWIASVKSIDNALQRVKRKLERYLNAVMIICNNANKSLTQPGRML